MPDPLSITTHGDAKAAKTIADTGKRANNVKPGASKIRTAYREAEQEIFQRNGGAVAWEKLKDSTRAAKRRRGQDHGTLRATNALYKSLTAANAANQVDDRQAHELRFGTTLPYAGFHESGRGQAKRPTQAFTASQQRRINDAIEDFIATGDTT
jgi:phage gpG-like protein